jgi:hypothetical protein
MSFKHTCTACLLEITYEKPEELKPYFYFKNGYWMKRCKKCILKEHKEKYSSGLYNYYKNKQQKYNKDYAIGVESGIV